MINKSVKIIVIPGGRDCDWLLLAADSLARVKRLQGSKVDFYANSSEFAQVFKIAQDDVTESGTTAVITNLITRLQQSGDVYMKPTECQVCEDCGQPELGQDYCTQCGGPLTKLERDGYFFRIRRHVSGVMDLVSQSNLVLPVFQRTDLLNSFGNRSAEDVLIALTVSRAEKQVTATNWLKFLALALAQSSFLSNEGTFAKSWSETYLFTSKDLTEYIFNWCGVIAALQLSPPGGIICHNCLHILDRKEQEVSPMLLAKNYGHEGLRYFILGSKVAPGENSFSEDQVIQRINHDLANELGNLVSRVSSLLSRFAEGLIPVPDILTRQTGDLDLRETALQLSRKIETHIESQELYQAVRTIKNFIGKTNRFIESTLPWQMAESPNQQARLNTVLYNLCEALRFLAVSLKPLLPEAAQSILYQLSLEGVAITAWDSLQQWGLIPAGTRITEQPPLFPRIVPGYGGIGPEPDLIMREELARINMIVARVVSAEHVPDYEGLYQLILYDGRQRCRVLAPVAHSYTPSFLSGKKVVMISNLRPVEIEGLHSEGEVLVAAADTGKLALVFIDDEIPEGSKVLCLS